MSALLEFSSCTRQVHVVSCYASTRAASREEKDHFFNQLNAFMSTIPAGEHYMISMLALVPGLIKMMMMMLVMNEAEYWDHMGIEQ